MLLEPLLNSVASAACYSLVAMGLSAVYAVRGFFHLAQGIIVALAAYSFFSLSGSLPRYVALLASLCIAILTALVIDVTVYSPLQRKRATRVGLLLASLGILTAGQNLISLFWGDAILRFPGTMRVTRIEVLGSGLSRAQLYGICAGGACWLVLALVIRSSGLGRLFQAVADDEELARSYGIRADLVKTFVTVLAGLFAGIAGIVIGADMGITPGIGFHATVAGVTGAIAGGLGNPLGAFGGSLLVATSQNVCAAVFPGEWQESITYALLLLVLSIRSRPKLF
jgi:branched-subunit amino acid ABC-type transport system permease component